MRRKKYSTIGLGGTFDHFHAGHEKFINFAWELGAKLMIGVTVPSLSLGKPWPKSLDSFEQRKYNVIHYCRQHHIAYEVFPLNDVFGPTLEGSPIRALVVTNETTRGADVINQSRLHLQMRPLPVYICDYFLADNGEPLHAEYIRAGKMDRRGRSYSRVFTEDLELSTAQRAFFAAPQGKIRLKPAIKGPIVAVVGDTSLENFITNKWPYDLGVYDLLKKRQVTDSSVLSQLHGLTVSNPPHHITHQLVATLQEALATHQRHIQVDGEEDLAAVALFLLLPLQSVVYYGQPDQGMIEVIITEEFKETVASILRDQPETAK